MIAHDKSMTKKLEKALACGLLDATVSAQESLVPSLVVNDPARGKKVFLTLEQELRSCRSFFFSVAFITLSGLQMLKPILRELEAKGVPGRILTTDYLTFSQPEALDALADLSNVEMRMYLCDETEAAGFHTKCYFFDQKGGCTVLVGSSNLTAAALSTSCEWNAKVFGKEQGEYIQSVKDEFDRLFDSPFSTDYRRIREDYQRRYEQSSHLKEMAAARQPAALPAVSLKPNAMQLRLIESLRELEAQGARRALLVSATGTGKTYASAFAMQKLKAGRVLFLVHREQIARQAMASYQRVFGDGYSFGLLGGGQRDYEAQFLFSTIQTFSRPEHRSKFSKDAFDYIIIDEVHRAAANSYRQVFEAFNPRLWLGMSATPVRTDHQSIYELFDYNVACSISLQDALEEDLLCPFHYYALSDLAIDDETIEDPSRFEWLIDDERIRHILEQAAYYGHCRGRLKGLMFVSSVAEARSLSMKLNERGLRTLALCGEDSQAVREAAIERVSMEEDGPQALDYLITVDIFNEGVDIPAINQVILLRPTQSAIVFTQQLGRGLRKQKGKEFLVVLDFIGLYANNYMIPIALSEARDGSKDSLRRFVCEGNRTIPGSSTVYFDEISRERIFRAIDEAKLNSYAALRAGYLDLYDALGRRPMLVDFIEHNAMDPMLIFSNTAFRCYPDFLNRVEGKTERIELSMEELDYLRFISLQWANGKRPHELLALQAIAQNPQNWMEEWKRLCKEIDVELPDQTLENILCQLRRQWLRGTGANSHPKALFLIEQKGKLQIAPSFLNVLTHQPFRKHFDDLIRFGLMRYEKRYRHQEKDGWFVLNEKYTYADTFRLMDLAASMIPNNVGGYMYDAQFHLQPVYINYEKPNDIVSTQDYEDRFVSRQHLIAYSKNGRTLESAEIKRLQTADKTGLKVPLFLRRNTRDGLKEFYYLGLMKPDGQFEEVCMKDGRTKAVRISYVLDRPVREDLYDFFTRTVEV